MSSARLETWNDCKIRFIEKELGEWWAVAADVALALDYRMASDMTRMLDPEEKDTHIVSTLGGNQRMTIISEAGIYEAIFNSRRPEAKEFKKWVKQALKVIRQNSGLEGFQVFRVLDKEHQKEAMKRLCAGIQDTKRIDYIKANTIANKAVSSMNGFPKMVKKNEMTPEMLVKRQQVLDDTVNLMSIVNHFGLDLKVSKTIYNKYVS
jgi:prophage antirepressor-like protein